MKAPGLTGIADAHYVVCDQCAHIWDIESGWPDPIVCPNCGGNALWRFAMLTHARQHAHDIDQTRRF